MFEEWDTSLTCSEKIKKFTKTSKQCCIFDCRDLRYCVSYGNTWRTMNDTPIGDYSVNADDVGLPFHSKANRTGMEQTDAASGQIDILSAPGQSYPKMERRIYPNWRGHMVICVSNPLLKSPRHLQLLSHCANIYITQGIWCLAWGGERNRHFTDALPD